jgi:DNA-binding NarL/FixJ family response regulator
MRHAAGKTAIIADPYPLWCDALRALLGGLDVTVVGEATTAASAVEMIGRHRPELVVADYSLATENGSDLLRETLAKSPDSRSIVLSEQSNESERDIVFAAGAWAYCAKLAEPDDVAAAIRQMFSPSIYFASARPRALPAEGAGREPNPLTKRETEILRLTAEGHSNSELARMLWVTEQTVKFHLSNIYRKLDVSNRTEASRWALVHGLLEGRESTVEVVAA